MSLERFRRAKIIILTQDSLVYQAARAMEDNHIGLVLVNGREGLAGIVTDRDLALAVLGGDVDPDTATLEEIMSEDVITCDIGMGIEEVARLMQEYRVRRIPLTEDSRVVGLVTFDDLVLDGSVPLDGLRSIVTAQLEVEAPQKPAGMLYPEGSARPELRAAGKTRALMRAKVRADEVYNRLVRAVASATDLDFERSEHTLLIGLCMLCRRLVPQEALHLIAQLPSKLHHHLEKCLDGPDRAVTTEAMKNEISRATGLEPERAGIALQAVFTAISKTVSKGQIGEVRGQLPEEMKHLFPLAA
ncbi:MAG TPA: CBS domain-containing protein [Terriglobales bacterium]|nr:CBS domain-containing protein [Terriglobales bacterium]